jgi:hypothetical protein
VDEIKNGTQKSRLKWFEHMNNMEEENATQNGRKMTKKKTQNQMDRPN